MKSILVIDDDELMVSFLATVLKGDGYAVEEALNGKSGFDKFQKGDYDLVITDLRMPDLSGVALISQGKVSKPDVPWIILTAHGSINNAVTAMKAGASDYMTKPLGSPEELRHVVSRVLREHETQQRVVMLSEELAGLYPPEKLIFFGNKMATIRKMVQEVAATPATVLITGDSGTGKELVARFIHNISSRRNKPFVAVHCAALTETLLESELFGHEKGAFTGATSLRKGRFEMADGGTLFLDEIGEISPTIQVKLLRVLQEREFERVGGSRVLSVDVRIIASTNKDLKAETARGKFREDLFYRLNVFPISMPPLRERAEAILPLADYFAQKFSTSFGKKIGGLSEPARSMLLSYPWPGNVRELQNIIERAVILARGDIEPDHLNLEILQDSACMEGLLKTEEVETIKKVLAETGGNRREAAEILGISLRTLQYRIREYDLK